MQKLEKYKDGMDMNKLKLITVVSHYNFNYYIGLGSDLLFAKSDDDNTTEWHLLSGTNNYFIGHSFTNQGDLLERSDKPYT
jgi:hypothetical protein